MQQRNYAIQYIRGLAMLGVIGIHVGAYSLDSPSANIHLFAILDIFTRFSVPIFFFLSAFGLFLNHDLYSGFSYITFIKRRFHAVAIPYFVWSFLYLVRYYSSVNWSPSALLETFIFGLACYHLYFLVILLWFYLLMPVWRWLLRHIVATPLPALFILLIFQIFFNYYSSYMLHYQPQNHIVALLLQYRLNYVVLHYIFIFLFGAICALRFSDFTAFIKKYRSQINIFFFASLAALLANYYWLLYIRGLTPVDASGIVHQLNPLGVIYTLAACLFFYAQFETISSKIIASLLNTLGHYSYTVYLLHPFVLAFLTGLVLKMHLSPTPPIIVAVFFGVSLLSLLLAILMEKLSQQFYMIGVLLTGSKQRPSMKA
ncbi:MAG: acyltransferase 3 [Firmicutes bacterium]|nr:acyltransferase 3 [Bacillota bacterium]